VIEYVAVQEDFIKNYHRKKRWGFFRTSWKRQIVPMKISNSDWKELVSFSK
jgi:hypothetical protein